MKQYHTCVYAYDTFSSGTKPYGQYRETIGFYNAAFWDVARNNKGAYNRLITVDGNAA